MKDEEVRIVVGEDEVLGCWHDIGKNLGGVVRTVVRMM